MHACSAQRLRIAAALHDTGYVYSEQCTMHNCSHSDIHINCSGRKVTVFISKYVLEVQDLLTGVQTLTVNHVTPSLQGAHSLLLSIVTKTRSYIQ
jgi:hypothetical protein